VTSAPPRIGVVPADRLAETLGLRAPLSLRPESLAKPFAEWRMEDDDQPILRYLYRERQPRRHLEFGTWTGAGAVYCLSECAATVWTINLPEGEVRTDGTVAYPAEDTGRSDAGFQIGRAYRDRGYGHRVCQVYCDSRDWDASALPGGFFDTCLIDGGHTPEVVISDTRKAIELVAPGGLVLWHDFCPDPDVIRQFSSTAGVVAGLARIWDEIGPRFRRVFWINPSFILLGERGERS
jgi:predicted O-methyltransferase YrrM